MRMFISLFALVLVAACSSTTDHGEPKRISKEKVIESKVPRKAVQLDLESPQSIYQSADRAAVDISIDLSWVMDKTLAAYRKKSHAAFVKRLKAIESAHKDLVDCSVTIVSEDIKKIESLVSAFDPLITKTDALQRSGVKLLEIQAAERAYLNYFVEESSSYTLELSSYRARFAQRMKFLSEQVLEQATPPKRTIDDDSIVPSYYVRDKIVVVPDFSRHHFNLKRFFPVAHWPDVKRLQGEADLRHRVNEMKFLRLSVALLDTFITGREEEAKELSDLASKVLKWSLDKTLSKNDKECVENLSENRRRRLTKVHDHIHKAKKARAVLQARLKELKPKKSVHTK